MYAVAKTVETENGSVWGITDEDGEEIGEIDIQRQPDGRRTFDYTNTKKDKKLSGEVSAADARSDEQLAKDIEFTGGSTKVPSFRPKK